MNIQSDTITTAGVSIGSAGASFALNALPWLQMIAVCIAIASGLITILKATRKNER